MSHSPDAGSLPPHRQPTLVALVAAGGAVGAAARYGITHLWTAQGLWWPILVINGIGAFLLGALGERLTRVGTDVGRRRQLRLFLGTGFCGAFTTYSTFAHDVAGMTHHGAGPGLALGLGEVAAGIACAALGMWVGAALSRASRPAEGMAGTDSGEHEVTR